mmetsp:Transcript_35756/g.86431  ORF Transcript_35756/g.86431 Transcript_35756/m.86431 type:complete len:498 (-) Transcript_35756:100-1593(-)
MVGRVIGQSSALMEQGPSKRARFADEEGKNVEEVMEEAEESGEESEEEELPPYSVVGNDVTSIRLVSGSCDDGEGRTFNPTYTHQVFRVKASEDAEVQHEELIIGYENPRIEITVASNTLKAHVDFKHDGTTDVKLLRNERLSRTNVLDAIQTHVPCDYAPRRSDVEEDAARTDFVPLGALISSEDGKDGATLELYHFTGETPEAARFVRRLQTMVLWTIETGSFIKVPDPAWNIYTLYSKKEEKGRVVYCLIGFITAYRYWVYDKASHSVDKTRLRVSQAVVLPPFQRKGHGARLLKAVYKAARDDPKVLDVSAEDPSPDFQALRDVTDLAMVRDGGDLDALCAREHPPLSELGLRYKLTHTQMKRLADAAHFVKLGLTDPHADPEKGGAEARALRLKIKQRLYKQALCESKGIGLVEDLGEEEAGPSKASGKGKARARHEEEEDEEVSPEEEQAAKLVKVWAEGGDPDMRREVLRATYRSLFEQHSRTAARLQRP